ncbi:drug-resistance related membrane protein [Caballeronia turbans]|jgi:DHA2 family multidrug resistance protein|uniref:hypothetical protein n=1 Tax=unclassified Caballeronia TaxID=2646786 RepID=UPI00074BAB41|nr:MULTISPECIES: hypothetical protein [unclassified Caballeronia]SAL38203.1 drug-resistance related membrane protein [Caballeronia turbans]
MSLATAMIRERTQATILAYLDVFAPCAIFAFLFIPLTFSFSPGKAISAATAQN